MVVPVAFRRDDQAASPLVVLTTFVLVAVLITVAVYALVFDRPKAEVQLVEQRDASGAVSLVVSHTAGGLDWSDVTLKMLDRAGTDVSAAYLHAPTGHIDRLDIVSVDPHPPAGSYVVLALHKGNEISRLALTL